MRFVAQAESRPFISSTPWATSFTVWSFFKEISSMTTITQICKPIPEERRAAYARKVFGSGYPLLVEPVIFSMADMLSPDYKGGMWLYCGICPEVSAPTEL